MSDPRQADTPLSLFWNEFKSSHLALGALIAVILIITLAVLAPWITPQDPYELSKLGYKCTILEARGFAGGRCQTARKGTKVQELGGEEQTCRFDADQHLNFGPWRIPYHHHSTLHYTREFDVPLQIMVNENNNAYMFAEGDLGPLANKPIRRMEVLADMHGHTNELVAKAAASGRLDGLLGGWLADA